MCNSMLTLTNCEMAFRVDGKVFAMWTYAGRPVESLGPTGSPNTILYVSLSVDDWILRGADLPPDGYQKPQGFSVTPGLPEAALAERMFHALAQNGTVQMPIQATWWAARFGMLVDQFGIPWMINCWKPA